MYKNGSKYKAVFMLCYIMLYYAYIKTLLGVFFLFPFACIYTQKLTGKINEENQIFYSDSAN